MRDRILGYGLLVGAALALTAAPAPAQSTGVEARPQTADSQAQAPASQASAPAAPGAPAATETRYTLAEVTGKRLPAEVEKGLRCREQVTAGSLVLRSDGRWRLETSRQEICGDRTEQDEDDEDGTYRSEGRTLRFLDDDGQEDDDAWGDRDIDVDDLRTGTLGADGTLTVELPDGKNRLVFRPEGR